MANPPNSSNLRVTHDIPKKQVTLKLQGLLLSALEDMSRDRQETTSQVIKDIIEQRLVKDKYLPEWWFERSAKL